MKEDSLQPAHIRNYSEIADLQHEYAVLYYRYAFEDGIVLEVVQQNNNRTVVESCYCPSISSEFAENILRLMYENSFGVGNWLDVLTDNGVTFELSDKPFLPHALPA